MKIMFGTILVWLSMVSIGHAGFYIMYADDKAPPKQTEKLAPVNSGSSFDVKEGKVAHTGSFDEKLERRVKKVSPPRTLHKDISRGKRTQGDPRTVPPQKRTEHIVSLNPELRGRLSPKPIVDEELLVKGYGRNISLNTLADQVKPSGWRFFCAFDLCKKQMITWDAKEGVAWKRLMSDGLSIVSPKNVYRLEYNDNLKVVAVKRDFDTPLVWQIKGDSLRKNLDRFSRIMGQRLKWDLGTSDWEIGQPQAYTGTYLDVVKVLLSAFEDKGIYLVAKEHKAAKVLEVHRRSSTATMFVGGQSNTSRVLRD